MDESIIYRKTRRGATELAATHGTLSHAARRVLILLNGERTVSELADLFGSDAVEHMIADLEAQGFARQIDPSEAGETTQAIPTQTIPTLVGDLRPVANEPPPARRASGWIAMGLFGAAVVIASGYWLVWRPNHAGPAAMAAGQAATGDQGSATPAEPQPIREVPLSGLPAVTVSANPAAKAAPANAEASASEDTVSVVPASASAIVPATASAESPAPGRRTSERTGSSTAAPKAAPPSEAESSSASATSAPARPGPATVASASNTRLEQTAVDAPAAEATSAGPSAATEREAQAAGRSVPVAASAPTPAAATATGAPSDKLAALTPSTRPKNEPVQLRPRKHDPPEFPGRALRARVFEGHVLAHLWITAEGTVDQVDIVKATPTRVFDDEVKRALGQWTFDPPGRAVDTTVELDFKQ